MDTNTPGDCGDSQLSASNDQDAPSQLPVRSESCLSEDSTKECNSNPRKQYSRETLLELRNCTESLKCPDLPDIADIILNKNASTSQKLVDNNFVPWYARKQFDDFNNDPIFKRSISDKGYSNEMPRRVGSGRLVMLSNDRGEYRVDDWDDGRQFPDYYDRTHRADRLKDIRQRSDRFRDDTDWRPHDRWSQDYHFYGRDDEQDSYVRKSYRQAGGDNRRSMRVEQQDLEEPEWFTEGPSSQLDTIELVGFETGERPKQQLRKGPALKDNLIRNTHRPEPEGSCSTLPKSGEGFDFNQFVEKSDAPPIEDDAISKILYPADRSRAHRWFRTDSNTAERDIRDTQLHSKEMSFLQGLMHSSQSSHHDPTLKEQKHIAGLSDLFNSVSVSQAPATLAHNVTQVQDQLKALMAGRSGTTESDSVAKKPMTAAELEAAMLGGKGSIEVGPVTSTPKKPSIGMPAVRRTATTKAKTLEEIEAELGACTPATSAGGSGSTDNMEHSDPSVVFAGGLASATAKGMGIHRPMDKQQQSFSIEQQLRNLVVGLQAVPGPQPQAGLPHPFAGALADISGKGSGPVRAVTSSPTGASSSSPSLVFPASMMQNSVDATSPHASSPIMFGNLPPMNLVISSPVTSAVLPNTQPQPVASRGNEASTKQTGKKPSFMPTAVMRNIAAADDGNSKPKTLQSSTDVSRPPGSSVSPVDRGIEQNHLGDTLGGQATGVGGDGLTIQGGSGSVLSPGLSPVQALFLRGQMAQAQQQKTGVPGLQGQETGVPGHLSGGLSHQQQLFLQQFSLSQQQQR